VAIDLTKKEIETLIDSSIKKFILSELDKEIKKRVAESNNLTHNEIVSLIHKSLVSMFQGMWFKHDIILNNIK